MDNEFFSSYMEYTRETESPRNYHRWCAISAAGALLSRNVWFTHGHFNVYPNLFCMLIGDPGTRKSTAIKLAKKVLGEAGYTNFAASKTSKEKFLLDLAGVEDGIPNEKSIVDLNLDWGVEAGGDVKEVFIMADEFNEFAGNGSVEFYDILGTLWDWDDPSRPYEHRYKNSQIRIYQPTVSLVAGNTPENFARAFPPEIIGTGFMSRLLLIHGERTGIKIAFPTAPSEAATKNLISIMQGMRGAKVSGPLELTDAARELLGKIYEQWIPIEDMRFVSYSNRRFSHLLKLCVIVAGSAFQKKITYETVVYANTMLSAAELKMPSALGEFGKSRNSDVTNKIMDVVSKATKPVTPKTIWNAVSRDLDKLDQLMELLRGLVTSEKLQLLPEIGSNPSGYLAKIKVLPPPVYVDWKLLTPEEQRDVC